MAAMNSKLGILQINSNELSGGAQRIAHNLFQTYRTGGHDSWLAVGHKISNDPDVLVIRHGAGRSHWARFWWSVHARCQAVDLNGRLSRWVERIGEPAALLDYFQGVENFHYPGTWNVLRLPPRRPDILHCHNFHGDYFDLRALPKLSSEIPTVITLHDAWLLSGHCAHSLECGRWKIGCGECPDLARYPALRTDGTAFNWRRKRDLYKNSRVYVAAPSQWLLSRVEESMLASAAIDRRVIPNGIDDEIFRPVDKRPVRAELRLATDQRILLFAANGIRANIWKDYQTLRAAIERVAASPGCRDMLLIALGEDAPPERVGGAEIRFVPYQASPAAVAKYYQAADVYIHAAKADTFPTTVIEALACGTPVVATSVGGIPEQIRGWDELGLPLNTWGLDEATGVLTPPGAAEEFAKAVGRLLEDEPARRRLAENAAADARRRFSVKLQAETYLGWYREILEEA
ncbi:MAG TPA: glycosyltransferase [Candidatus Binatia bacterium]